MSFWVAIRHCMSQEYLQSHRRSLGHEKLLYNARTSASNKSVQLLHMHALSSWKKPNEPNEQSIFVRTPNLSTPQNVKVSNSATLQCSDSSQNSNWTMTGSTLSPNHTYLTFPSTRSRWHQTLVRIDGIFSGAAAGVWRLVIYSPDPGVCDPSGSVNIHFAKHTQ